MKLQNDGSYMYKRMKPIINKSLKDVAKSLEPHPQNTIHFLLFFFNPLTTQFFLVFFALNFIL
jgi:hypothetical protein